MSGDERTSAPARILLASEGATAMLELLQAHGFDVVVADLSRPSASHVRELLRLVDVVIIDVTLAGADVLAGLHDLYAATLISDVSPRLLCFSNAHRKAKFVLEIQSAGIRYVSILGVPMLLLEAIDLLLAEIEELRKNRPSFTIWHRFAFDGGCHEGESVEAVLFPRTMTDPQLQLGLAERLTFDFLAQHPRLSFDARQIAEALNGLRFYREHGSNASVLQRVKVRVPTIKVIIGRIRHAMASKFVEANLQIDAFDVLRSFFAAGTNRVLYKLHADCKVFHSSE